MTLSQEVNIILQGGDIKKIRQDRTGRFTKETIKYLEDNQIAY
jgi:hypothetical protein